jgi:hypothetical protein
MATDVARLSFDAGRHYTGVIAQQGRVSLEAEQNEQRVIEAQERRQELLDIVGTAGTPDNGYAVSSVGGVLTVGIGTMYVGGLRVELDTPAGYDHQPDWLDQPGTELVKEGNEHVVLLLQERDVTAVEDGMLYEPALGGPDGAARTRIVQRIELLRTLEGTCAGALGGDEKGWEARGLTFDPATMELNSNGRLLVTWEGTPEPANPCEPSSAGGYLGAENQLIRVQITNIDPAAGTFDIVWGYDDASMLYVVTPDTSTNPILTLQRSPVDDYHRPRAGQAVQALRSTAELQSTDAVVEGYVAALGGQVGVLTAPYDPDTKTVQFPAPLPAAYTDPSQTPQLYLRVWEELLTGNQLGTPISLTGTGVQVTISLDGGGIPHVDDYWCIGVRPSTPTTVYPDRLVRTPQPPDGPRQWVCPLAVVTWQDGKLVILEDCRHHFPPLIDAPPGGCCTIEVHPADAASGQLAALIDSAAAGRVPGDLASRVTVCFAPGRYELPEPIVLREQHSNLILRGCSEAAVLAAQPGQEQEFGQGIVVLAGANNVTVTGFEFELPQVPAPGVVRDTSGTVVKPDVISAIDAVAGNSYVSIGIRPVNCAALEISDCIFLFSAAEQPPATRTVFGAGVFAAGDCPGLLLNRNQFLRPQVQGKDEGSEYVLAGYLLTPTLVSEITGTAWLAAVLDDAEIRENVFDGIAVAVAVVALLGSVRVADNQIRRSYGGVWLIDVVAAANADLGGVYELPGEAADQASLVRTALAGGLLDAVLQTLVVFSVTFPLPQLPGFSPAGVTAFDPAQLDQAQTAAEAQRQDWMRRFVQDVATEHPAARTRRARTTKAAAAAAERAQSVPPVDFNQGAGGAQGLVAAAANQNLQIASAGLAGLAGLARIEAVAGVSEAKLRIERNDIECAVAGIQATGPALFVLVSPWGDYIALAEVSTNLLVSGQSAIAAALFGVAGMTVTGNIVGASDSETTFSLAVAVTAAAAITGNVIIGQASLPAGRPFPPPLDTWLPLNTVVG